MPCKPPGYVGRSAVVGAAPGQADAPMTGAGVREVECDHRPRFRDDWHRRQAEQGPYEDAPDVARGRLHDLVRRGWEWLTVPEDDRTGPMQEP